MHFLYTYKTGFLTSKHVFLAKDLTNQYVTSTSKLFCIFLTEVCELENLLLATEKKRNLELYAVQYDYCLINFN